MIEIVNDDMPFLVDSVMAELTERGLDIRLVVHPILAVERDDKTGKLTAAPGEARSGKDEPRESFIHIHVERIEDAAPPRRDRAGAGAGAGRGPASACRTGGR